MDVTGQKLLNLLFNPGETVCVSDNKYAHHSIPLENAVLDRITLVNSNQSIPIRYCTSNDLTLVAINPIKGFRNDENVTAFRSFLIEMDTYPGTETEIPLKVQLSTIKHYEIPISAQIYSGGKSIHNLIVLDEDLPNEKVWRSTVEWIFKIITYSDPACKNPSRMVRIPGAVRPDTSKKQRLLALNHRISHKELFDWLNRYEHLRPVAKEKKILTGAGDFDKLSPWARYQLRNGLDFTRGRSNTWFALAVDFAKAGYDEDQALEILEPRFNEEHDFREKEWLRTIRSGFEYVLGN